MQYNPKNIISISILNNKIQFVFLSIFFFFVFFTTHNSYAISVLPSEMIFFYNNNSENDTFTGRFLVFDDINENNVIYVSYPSNFSKAILFSSKQLSFKSSESKKNLDFIINLTNLKRRQGRIVIPITFTQKILNNNKGISAQLSVIAKIFIIVSYDKPFIQISQSYNANKLSILLTNLGPSVYNCTVNLSITNSTGRILSKLFYYPLIEKNSQQSITLKINKIKTNFFRSNVTISCKNYTNKANKIFYIPSFPFNVSYTSLLIKNNTIFLTLTFRNKNPYTLQSKQIYYYFIYNDLKTKTHSFYLSSFLPYEKKSTTIISNLSTMHRQPLKNLTLVLFTNINNTLVSYPLNISVEKAQHKFVNFSSLFITMFVLLFVVIVSFVKFKIKYSK